MKKKNRNISAPASHVFFYIIFVSLRVCFSLLSVHSFVVSCCSRLSSGYTLSFTSRYVLFSFLCPIFWSSNTSTPFTVGHFKVSKCVWQTYVNAVGMCGLLLLLYRVERGIYIYKYIFLLNTCLIFFFFIRFVRRGSANTKHIQTNHGRQRQ